LYLGVDGGQTTTRAVIGDSSGRVLGSGFGGQSNHVKGPEGRTRLIEAVTRCVSEAARNAGIPLEDLEFDAACLGFTGGIEGKYEILSTILKCQRLMVTDDLTVALAGAHAAQPGIITIAGTGSVSMGRNARGQVARAGGWGYAFGDEGGAWGIVREAMRAALRMDEEWGPATLLRALLLQATGEIDLHTLRRKFYTEDYPRPRVAAFARLVDEAVQQGDSVATGVLESAADHLVTLTQAVRRRLFAGSDPVNVSCIGGVFQSGLIRTRFTNEMKADSAVNIVPPLHKPPVGALLLAIHSRHSKDEQVAAGGNRDAFTPLALESDGPGDDEFAKIDAP
jgi:N-acetylglucosamine kinase-like BadF-type ATPase